MIIAAGLLLIAGDWRLAIGAVTAQYVFAVVLFAQVLPPQVAGVKLLIGLMSCLILFLSATQAEARRKAMGGEQASLLQMRGTTLPTGLPFRTIAALIIALSTWAIAGRPESVLPEVSSDVSLAVFALSGASVMVIALTEAPLEIGLGLLTLLTGFELFYHAVEPSLAAIALLSMAHFGIAVVTGYFAIITAGR